MITMPRPTREVVHQPTREVVRRHSAGSGHAGNGCGIVMHPHVERSRVIAAPVVSSNTRPQFAGTSATLASSEFGFGEN
jgi:hypothetical protein